jgi:peptidoglycan/LPS O-acetylase OafA/YrhL
MKFLEPIMPVIVLIICLLVVSISVAGSDQYPWVQWVLIIASVLLILGLAIQLLRSTNKPFMRLKISSTKKKR